jgi:hypothetical protein
MISTGVLDGQEWMKAGKCVFRWGFEEEAFEEGASQVYEKEDEGTGGRIILDAETVKFGLGFSSFNANSFLYTTFKPCRTQVLINRLYFNHQCEPFSASTRFDTSHYRVMWFLEAYTLL